MLINKPIVKPFYMKKAVNKELTMFNGFEQCDAQEFLTFFLNKIAEDLQRFESKENNQQTMYVNY